MVMRSIFLTAIHVSLFVPVMAGAASAVLLPSHVTQAVSKVDGMSAATILAPELRQIAVAQGDMLVESPQPPFAQYYGYSSDDTMLPALGTANEATKTEPDKNTYLVLSKQRGPDANYDYGTHFLYQGHEGGVRGADGMKRGYITRINLDADVLHRVTVLATDDVAGNSLPTFDGSTWYPFSQHLLFTGESGKKGGVYQSTSDYPARVEPLLGVFGRAGFEGVQADDVGNLWLVEDAKYDKGTESKYAFQPSNFVYRLVPKDKKDLIKGGILQALQVMNSAGAAIELHAGQADADILSSDNKELYSYGKLLKAQWVTLHDTATDGTASFDANALAREKHATPFKRTENGLFRPGSGFKEFFFTVTGDTDLRTEAVDQGGFGALLKLTQASAQANEGVLHVLFRGDVDHSGFDNLAFWSEHHLVVAEDAGDQLHTQRGRFDSLYLFDVREDYSLPGNSPIRILALGRDTAATLDAKFLELSDAVKKAKKDKKDAGDVSKDAKSSVDPSLPRDVDKFQNDGDNEITGIHIFDGNPTVKGQIGVVAPRPFQNGWRVFYTQQHGANTTYEILKRE